MTYYAYICDGPHKSQLVLHPNPGQPIEMAVDGEILGPHGRWLVNPPPQRVTYYSTRALLQVDEHECVIYGLKHPDTAGVGIRQLALIGLKALIAEASK